MLKMICFNFFVLGYLMIAMRFFIEDIIVHMLSVQEAVCMHLIYFIQILFSFLSFF